MASRRIGDLTPEAFDHLDLSVINAAPVLELGRTCRRDGDPNVVASARSPVSVRSVLRGIDAARLVVEVRAEHLTPAGQLSDHVGPDDTTKWTRRPR
jgi:hypothetical protein